MGFDTGQPAAMACDRRRFSLGMAFALALAACTPPRESQAMTPGAEGWAAFARRFLRDGRIVDTGNGGISHSEGQGYGMVLAVLAHDRDAFEAMAAWTAQTLRRDDVALHAWKFDPAATPAVADRNNATDGDILIAWALGRAAALWNAPAHAEAAAAIRQAIRTRLVIDRFGYRLLLPGLEGFALADRVVINPSYVIWPALDAFAQADGPGAWDVLIEDCAAILARARFGPHALPADWIDVAGPAHIAPAAGRPPRFGFDAVRIPLYAMAGRRASLAEPVVAWWRSLQAAQQPVPAWIDVISGETAPYPLSAGGMAVLARATGRPAPAALDGDYYAAVLQMLAAQLP